VGPEGIKITVLKTLEAMSRKRRKVKLLRRRVVGDKKG
jgi:hypothetical protein